MHAYSVLCGLNVVYAPCKSKHPCESGEKCIHKFRITSTARVTSPLHSQTPTVTLPNLHEKSRSMSLELNYSLEKTLHHPTVTNRSSFTITPGEDGLIYQRKYVGGHLIETFKRNKVDLLPQNTPYRRIGGFSHSLPDLCAPDIIHMSKTVLETYKMSPSFPRSKQSYLNSFVDLSMLF